MSTSILMQERMLVEFLLGRMPADQREEIERRLFVDDAFEEDLQATADDLIRDYLTAKLPPEDRWLFESHFLSSPRHRQRLAFMRDLLPVLARVSAEGVEMPRAATLASRRRLAIWGLAAAVGAIALSGVPLTRRILPGGTQREAVAPLSSLTAMPAPAPESDSEPQRSETATVSLVRLPPESGTPVSVLLTPLTNSVRIEVAVDERYPSFDAVVRKDDGEVWRAEDLVPSAAGKPLQFTVPARVLTSDRYALLIEGEALRDRAGSSRRTLLYPLRVVRTH